MAMMTVDPKSREELVHPGLNAVYEFETWIIDSQEKLKDPLGWGMQRDPVERFPHSNAGRKRAEAKLKELNAS
jgi:hypothetical protein